jgi:cellulose synthase operon protein C
VIEPRPMSGEEVRTVTGADGGTASRPAREAAEGVAHKKDAPVGSSTLRGPRSSNAYSALGSDKWQHDDLPQLPPVIHDMGPPTENGVRKVAEVAALSLEREAVAMGSDPAAAFLYLEVGRLYEEELDRPFDAATAYERAFRADRQNPSVLHASKRLFAVAEKWRPALQILDQEIDTAPTPELRATLFAEKGAILEDKLHDQNAAEAAYHQALSTWSAEPLAIQALERMYLLRREYGQVYEIYLRALAVTKAAPRRVPLLLSAAQLAEDRLNQPDAATEHYGELLRLEPSNGIALAALRRLTLQGGKWSALVDVLTLSARSTSGPQAAQFLLSAARMQNERLDRPAEALVLLLEALKHDPDNLTLLKEIEGLYETNHHFEEVVKVVRREAEVTSDPRSRAPLLFKLGTILDERILQPQSAIAVLEEAVRIMPTYLPARQSLGRLYGRVEAWDKLVSLFETEIQVEEETGERVSRLFKLADLLETRLGNATKAIEVLSALLELDAAYQPARKSLERLLQRREDWPRLVDLYEQELTLTSDIGQKIFLLGRIALFAEDKLRNIDHAIHSFLRILDCEPLHRHALRNLGRLASLQGKWPEVIRYYELEMDATDDQAEVVSILYNTGNVIEERMSDADRAIQVYEKVLTLNPTYLPALRSLGRIYQSAGRWSDLVTMFQRELEVSRGRERCISLLFRKADILRDHLDDEAQAAVEYERVLELDPSSLPALRSLEQIYERTKDFNRLISILQREADAVEGAEDRSVKLLRIAEIEEEKLDRADRAAEVYQEVVRIGLHFDEAIRALVRIYSSEGMWNALSRALHSAIEHTDEPRARVALLVRCAEVAGDKLGNLDAAADFLERALALDPESRVVLAQIERVCVARRDWRRSVSVAEKLAELETEPRLYAARQVRIAMVKESQLEPPESGAEHYRRALTQVPDHPMALRALERAYRKSRDWTGLAVFYEREALVTQTVSRRAYLLLRGAKILEFHLGAYERAAELYDQALELAGDSLPALQGRRRVADKLGDFDTLLSTLSREQALSRDPGRQDELRFELARGYSDVLEDVQKAIPIYRELLEANPHHSAAFAKLSEIYDAQGAWGDLAELLNLRINSVSDSEEQAKLLFRLGVVSEDKTSDESAAVSAYREVVTRAPDHGRALSRLGNLLFKREDWPGALEVLERATGVLSEGREKVDAWTKLGMIYQTHQVDLVKAVRAFQSAVQLEPNNVECLRRLAALYRSAEDWTSAANVLLRLAEGAESIDQKVETLIELSSIYESHLNDPTKAVRALEKATELDPIHAKATLSLCDLHEREGNWQALAEATSAYVKMLPRDQASKATPIHLKMAAVFEKKLGDDKRAINALKYALDGQPTSEEALVSLGRLYGSAPDSYLQAIEVHRRLLAIQPFRVESYRQMHRMFEHVGSHDKAFVTAEILVYLRSAEQAERLFYDEHKSKVAARGSRLLEASDHDRWLTHPHERGPLRAVFEILAAELSKSFPGDLAAYEFNKNTDRHGPKSPLSLRSLADELAGIIETPPFDLWISHKHDREVFIENDRPMALIVGASLDRRVQEKEQRFLLGRALERLKGGHHLLEMLSANDAVLLITSVAHMAGVSPPASMDLVAVDGMQKQVLRSVSGRAKRMLLEVASSIKLDGLDLMRHRSAARRTANRAGLMFSNDIEVAVRCIAGDHPVRAVFSNAAEAEDSVGRIPEVRDILSYAVSEAYFELRARLGFSIQS